MVTWNCTSGLSAAVVVLLSDCLKWDFLVQMRILATVTRNPEVLLSPYPSHHLQLFRFRDTWLKWTYAWSLQNGLDDRRNRITQWEFRNQPPIGTAGVCDSLTLIIVFAWHLTMCVSHVPLWKVVMQLKWAGGGMSPPPFERLGCQPLLSVVPPRAVGIGVEKGLHTSLCLLAYAGESPAHPASAVTACGGGGEVVLQPLRKLVVSILSFAAAALFSPLITPPTAPPCEWYVWTISFKTSFLSRLDG